MKSFIVAVGAVDQVPVAVRGTPHGNVSFAVAVEIAGARQIGRFAVES
jgi:hypothetical protein